MTFSPHECDGTTLAGVSDVLGACRVRLTAVDQVILGPMIREVAEGQAYGIWKLRDAVEPEFAREGADGVKAANAGGDSMLIGKPAPDFQLELVDGGHFKLSEQKGKVIVLDFWATWCGPCIQAMPELLKLADEFKGREVKFVSINMQEDQASISSVLERMKIHPTVALDIDGVAGERYQVSAIPQIVVIDTETKVADLVIGANPGYIDQLRTTIQKALEPKKSK